MNSPSPMSIDSVNGVFERCRYLVLPIFADWQLFLEYTNRVVSFAAIVYTVAANAAVSSAS